MRVIIVSFLIVLIFSSCKKYRFFDKVDRENIYPDSEQGAENGAHYAYNYILSVIKGYQQTCLDYKVNPKYYDSLTLMNNNKISAQYFYSSERETILYVYKSNENTFYIYGSRLPAQVQALYPIGSLQYDEEFFKEYDTIRAQLTLRNVKNIFLVGRPFGTDDFGFDFNSSFKFLSLPEASTPLCFRGVRASSYDQFGNVVERRVFSYYGGGIITPSISYIQTATVGDAWMLGRDLAIQDIQDLFFKSRYFREALANDRLSPVAKEMLVKHEHAVQDADYKYDSTDFLLDKKRLQLQIDSFHIKLSADDFFNNIKYQIRPGTLLWFYSSYAGYTFQWLIVSFLFAVISFAFKYFRLFEKLSKRYIVNPWLKTITFLGAAEEIFRQGVNKMPLGMSVKYWVWPLLLLCITYIILYLYRPKPSSQKKGA